VPQRTWNLNIANWIPSFNAPTGHTGVATLGPALDKTNEILQDARANEEIFGDAVILDWLDKAAGYLQIVSQYRIGEQGTRTRPFFRKVLPDRPWAQETNRDPSKLQYQRESPIQYTDGTNIRQPSSNGKGVIDTYRTYKMDELATVPGAVAEFEQGMQYLRDGQQWTRTYTDVNGISKPVTSKADSISKAHIHNIDSFSTAINIMRAPPPPACDIFSRKRI
jgi:hypothetical protein